MGAMDPANHNHPHDWLGGEAVILTPVRLTGGRGTWMSLSWLDALRGSDPAATECIFITLAKTTELEHFFWTKCKAIELMYVLP